jgi:hypothetical protein
MRVEVLETKRQSKTDRHGWKADLKVPSKKKAVIYQNVRVYLYAVDSENESDKLKYSFTEAWVYDPKKNITDSFLIPLDWRKNQAGYIKIKTVLWSEDTDKINPKLKKGTIDDYWGNLHGSFDLLTPKMPITVRRFKASWNNIGKTKSKYFTNGKDLTLDRDVVYLNKKNRYRKIT